ALLAGLRPADAGPPTVKGSRSLADDLKALDGQWEFRTKQEDKEKKVERLFRLTLKDGKGLLTIWTTASARGAAGLSVKDHRFDYGLARGDIFDNLNREKVLDPKSRIREPAQVEGKPRPRLLLLNHTLYPPWDGRMSVLQCVLDGDKLKLKGPLKVGELKGEH